jgi:hypothetical protein
MSYPLNYPTPQYANVQTFYAPSSTTIGANATQTWIKPQGASFVWFTLIGGGGGSDATLAGGGSSAVTNCLVPAFLIPDELQILVGVGGGLFTNGQDTTVRYTAKGTYTLLTATSGRAAGAGGSASTSNYFSAMGFFQSVAGQAGNASTQSASATTFLSGGGSSTITSNYGYATATGGGNGFFQMQPIIVGVAGGSSTSDNVKTGIGCGGALGGTNGNTGGNGLVVIISW